MKMITDALRRIILCAAIVLAAGSSIQAAAPGSQSLPGHFSWGIDVGGAIDMSGHDMSTLDIDAGFGYRNRAIQLLGIGAGINIPVDNSRRTFPVYAVLRTNFIGHPSLCFMDARVGVVVNNMETDATKTAFYCSPGLGFNLATGRTFRSYLILSYIYNGLKAHAEGNPEDTFCGVHLAAIRLGINF